MANEKVKQALEKAGYHNTGKFHGSDASPVWSGGEKKVLKSELVLSGFDFGAEVDGQIYYDSPKYGKDYEKRVVSVIFLTDVDGVVFGEFDSPD